MYITVKDQTFKTIEVALNNDETFAGMPISLMSLIAIDKEFNVYGPISSSNAGGFAERVVSVEYPSYEKFADITNITIIKGESAAYGWVIRDGRLVCGSSVY